MRVGVDEDVSKVDKGEEIMDCETWCTIISTLVDIIVGILTLLTLIAALKANKQNRKEIEQAKLDFTYSIKIHEQEKNIALLDKRVSILNSFEKMKNSGYEFGIRPKITKAAPIPFSEKEIIILFRNDRSILSNYRLLINYIEQTDKLLSDLNTYYKHYNTPDGEGGYNNNVWGEILKYEDLIGKYEDSQQIEIEFEDYCKRNSFSENVLELNECINYNYFEIRNSISKLTHEFEQTKNNLVGFTEAFVEESIKFVSE
ncbi:MAG: hypothetical protein NC320_13495 [Clostridium sp.]|nr:hypothetical protein [Clostridium sp.]